MMTDKKLYENFKNSRFYEYFYSLVNQIREFEKAGVYFLFFQTPVAERIDNLSKFEKERLDSWTFDFNHIDKHDLELIKSIYSPEMEIEYLKELYSGARVAEKNGVKFLLDYKSEYVNIINGRRFTTNQPQRYHNTIYIFGQCTARGTGVEDRETIASYLQCKINDKYPMSYMVDNYAVGCGSDLHDDLEYMKSINYRKGDVVILCTNLEIVPLELFNDEKINAFDCSILFYRPHNYGEWFTDMTFHTNARGNKVIADYVFDTLEDRHMLGKSNHDEDIVLKAESDNQIDMFDKDIEEYINYIVQYKVNKENVGAIVMNCNPFTNGHRYLIETAARQVDVLYIFVVEEDKSFFSFKDRMMLVKEGTKDIKNVVVLPSGKYIISLATFPGYFNKDNENTALVDATMDIKIFCKYIAPAMNIKVRFVGEEPIDMVTNQYNRQMERILSSYDIKFIEIERKKYEENVISASNVRKLLEEKNFEKIREIVPVSTFRYLVHRFGE